MSTLEDKPDARILDATASNRSIWKTKESDKIIWIDIEPELEVSPDLIIDCTKTHFPDKSIFTVFFDPPHWWGQRTGENFFTCRNMEESKAFTSKYGMRDRSSSVTYYGTDRYKTKTELLSFIHKAQKEFQHILTDNGILWLNWSEVKLPLSRIIAFFRDWDEMLRFSIKSPYQIIGESQSYWIMFMKKSEIVETLDLADFTNKEAENGV